MQQLIFTERELLAYPIALLVPVIKKDEIQREYLDKFKIPYQDIKAYKLFQSRDKKKTPAALMKQYIVEELVPELTASKTQYIIVCDSEYFKILTKQTKADVNLGYVLNCVYGPWKVVYVPNYKAIFYNPELTRNKIAQGIEALLAHINGTYVAPGKNIVKFEEYPNTIEDIKRWLNKLILMECPLTIDIEGFSLKHHNCGIGTIAFAWNKHEGIAFPVDYEPIPNATKAPYGKQVYNKSIRKLLRNFFDQYIQTAIYHGAAFDAYVLIYQLYMSDILDTKGLLHGLNILLKNWDCTKLISYLATNSCARVSNSLKDQAQEFAGNYAESEIKDITKIPLDNLLRYNLIDTLSTWHTYEKHHQTMIDDQQEEIYEKIFKPATLDIIQMQLTGMPLSMPRVLEVENIFKTEEQAALDIIHNHPIIQQYTDQLNEDWVTWKNNKLKVKRVTLADAKEIFNPNSSLQLQNLLYNWLNLPIINLTETKQASTDKDTLMALINHTDKQDIKDLLNALLDYAAIYKILSTYIPPFKSSVLGPDGWHYLFGSFNLGGTVSGRLSSSEPNLQNLPSSNTKRPINKRISKLIKSCFQAPPGWLFVGLDFNSLEDKISALTTKDPNKLKVYTDGYDGHSLRAYSYFREQMSDIIDTILSINSISKKYPELRQDSKVPTFALTYDGTFRTLMNKCGFSEEKAKMIEARYHELYVVSDNWVKSKLQEASKTGYLTVAFGLRVRTPLLAQVVMGTSKTPYEAKSEGRTAGNALGQSWGLLNSRAASEFMGKVRVSDYKYDIKPCSQIHDAQYYMCRDDCDLILYINDNLVKAANWQDHPDIWHEQVKLGGEVIIYYPNWGTELKIPNQVEKEKLLQLVEEYKQTFNK